MSESVILSTLQLCQQAISSLTQTNRSNENKYSLQTAMTSTNTGIPAASISDVDLVSPEIRADILAGKDVNLNILLIPNYITPAIKKMKEKDERLTRNLSLDEFIVAFGRYKKIMCSAFPNRSNELDSYLSHIIETANVWPERFYEYHQMFSSKCASMLLQHNIKIDWAKGDFNLRTLICAGSSVKSCDACGSNIHSAGMCPHRNSKQHSGRLSSGYKVYRQHKDIHGREILFHEGEQICNNYNSTKGCKKPYCKYAHNCTSCKSNGHAKFQCPQNLKMMTEQKQKPTTSQQKLSTTQ